MMQVMQARAHAGRDVHVCVQAVKHALRGNLGARRCAGRAQQHWDDKLISFADGPATLIGWETFDASVRTSLPGSQT